jgi:hypothetical protein
VALLRPPSSSLLFRHCFFSLFPLLPLSTTFFSLYSGVIEVLVLLEAGGGVLAHGRRLQAAAAVLLFQCFPMILPVCFLQVYNSSFLSLCFGLSLSFGFFSFSSFSSSSVFSFLPSFCFCPSSLFSLSGLFFLFLPFGSFLPLSSFFRCCVGCYL